MSTNMIDLNVVTESITHHAWPRYDPPILKTLNNTPYFQSPGVVLIGRTECSLFTIKPFIEGFDTFSEEEARDYVCESTNLRDVESLVKFAGQLCYLSFGQNRTKAADVQRYIDNLKQSGHGSVFEHVSFSLLFYGVDRAFTHELVRHRAGFAYSQLSQRYVDGTMLRFCEDFEYQDDPELHARFITSIDQAKSEYEARAELLRVKYEKQGRLVGVKKTDARKMVNQAARRSLPNEVEAPIVVTGNVRAWRHFLEQRASGHADVGIRRPAFIAGLILKQVAPAFFSDYEMQDASASVQTSYPKV